MTLDNVIALDKKYYMNTFGDRVPVCFTKGEGIKLWDTNGKVYYDFLAGIAVNALGHSHPALVEAIVEQAQKLIHCSNYYYVESQAKLAQLIVENSSCDKVFFANSGAEANEGAIKLARLYFKKKGFSNKFEIITLEKSFHGRTLATIAATGQEKHQKNYCPLTPKFMSVPMNNFDAITNAITENTCGIMLEPIQGESGVNPANVDYIKQVRKLCDDKGILLIFDEVQCGFGRTGKMFGYEHFNIEPDIFTLAKALGGGFPIGALCAKEPYASAFEPGDHGSTFGGNPLACSAGYAALSTIIKENLCDNSANMGEFFINSLKKLKEKHPIITEVRGKGLMIGVEFSEPKATEIKEKLFGAGYLIGAVGDKVIRMLPPLIINKENIDRYIIALDNILKEYTLHAT